MAFDTALDANFYQKGEGVYNAGHSDFGSSSDSDATRIQAAIDAAAADSVPMVLVPDTMLPYSGVTFNSAVRMVREGQLADVYDVRAYGAAGNGTANDDLAIQAAIDTAESEGSAASGFPLVVIPRSASGYAFASQITNPSVVPIRCHADLIFTGSGEDALVFGAADGSAHQSRNEVPSIIRLRRDTQDWSDSFAGLALKSVFQLSLFVHVQDFETGVILQGWDTGCAYNTIFLKRIQDNRVGLRLHSANNTGWANQNTFIGGRFSTSSGTSSALDVHGVEFVHDSDSLINANQFHNPSFELFNTGSGFTSAIHGRGATSGVVAQENNFWGYRLEGTDHLLSGRGLRFNNLITSRGAGGSVNQPSTTLINGDNDSEDLVLSHNLIFDARGDLHAAFTSPLVSFSPADIVEDGTNETISSPGKGGWHDASSGAVRGDGTLQDEYVEVSDTSVLGFTVDLSDEDASERKIIYAIVESPTSNAGRIGVVCFDSSGTVITDTDACNLSFNAGRGYHLSGADGSSPSITVLMFRADVDTAHIGVTAGSANAQVGKFLLTRPSLSRLRVVPTTGVPHYADGSPKSDRLPAVPGAGLSYPAGLFVRNTNTGTGEVLGWIYDGASWNPVGARAEDWGSEVVTLDANGEGSIAHGLSATPTAALVSIRGGDRGESVEINTLDATSINIYAFDGSGADLASVDREIYWLARL